jgi:hypothetical protein
MKGYENVRSDGERGDEGDGTIILVRLFRVDRGKIRFEGKKENEPCNRL